MLKDYKNYIKFCSETNSLLLEFSKEIISVLQIKDEALAIAISSSYFYYFGIRYKFLVPFANEIKNQFLTDFIIIKSGLDDDKKMLASKRFGSIVFSLMQYDDIQDANISEIILSNFKSTLPKSFDISKLDNLKDEMDSKCCSLFAEFNDEKLLMQALYCNLSFSIFRDNAYEFINEFEDEGIDESQYLPVFAHLFDTVLIKMYEKEGCITSDLESFDRFFEIIFNKYEQNKVDFEILNLPFKNSELLFYELDFFIYTTLHDGKITTKEQKELVNKNFKNKMISEALCLVCKTDSDDTYSIIVKTVYSHFDYFYNNLASRFNLNLDEIVVMSIFKDIQLYLNDERNEFTDQHMMFFTAALGGATMDIKTKKSWDFNAFIPQEYFNTKYDAVFLASITAIFLCQSFDNRDLSISFIGDEIYKRGKELFELCKSLTSGQVEPAIHQDNHIYASLDEQSLASEIQELKEIADSIISNIKQ